LGYQVTTTILAFFVVGAIIWLIRRDRIHPRKAVGWLILAFVIGVLGLFPQISDSLAARLGVSYPPTLILVLSFIVLLIKLLRMDIATTREQRRVKMLSQRLSVLEKRLEERIKLDD